jgi:hypothetical protein
MLSRAHERVITPAQPDVRSRHQSRILHEALLVVDLDLAWLRAFGVKADGTTPAERMGTDGPGPRPGPCPSPRCTATVNRRVHAPSGATP